jgi:hypothetical protein
MSASSNKYVVILRVVKGHNHYFFYTSSVSFIEVTA